ncbi:hypothetical protein HDU86_003673 [Geranomyces michiganensis]|nr:hypothetical protein HDU86_003673 [Geranomyces michiganensis]
MVFSFVPPASSAQQPAPSLFAPQQPPAAGTQPASTAPSTFPFPSSGTYQPPGGFASAAPLFGGFAKASSAPPAGAASTSATPAAAPGVAAATAAPPLFSFSTPGVAASGAAAAGGPPVLFGGSTAHAPADPFFAAANPAPPATQANIFGQPAGAAPAVGGAPASAPTSFGLPGAAPAAAAPAAAPFGAPAASTAAGASPFGAAPAVGNSAAPGGGLLFGSVAAAPSASTGATAAASPFGKPAAAASVATTISAAATGAASTAVPLPFGAPGFSPFSSLPVVTSKPITQQPQPAGAGQSTNGMGPGFLGFAPLADLSPEGQITERTHYYHIPKEVTDQLDQLEQFIRPHRVLADELQENTHVADSIHKLFFRIENTAVKSKVLQNDLARDQTMIRALNDRVTQELRNSDLIHRFLERHRPHGETSADGSGGGMTGAGISTAPLKHDAVMQYFEKHAHGMRKRMGRYKMMLDQLDEAMTFDERRTRPTPRKIVQVMKEQDDCILAVGRRIAHADHAVQREKRKWKRQMDRGLTRQEVAKRDLLEKIGREGTSLAEIAKALAPEQQGGWTGGTSQQQQQPQQQQQQLGTSQFGQSFTAGGGLFGQPARPAGPAAAPGGFGGFGQPAASASAAAPAFGGFGQLATSTAAAAPGFGGGFGAKPAVSAAPAPGFGGFGQPAASAAAAPTFGAFGQPAASTAAPGFGGFGQPPASSAAAPGFGGFGQPAASAAAPTGFAGFGQPAASAPAPAFGGFGQPAASAAPTGFFAQQAKPAAAPGFGGFGQPAASAPGGFGAPSGLSIVTRR